MSDGTTSESRPTVDGHGFLTWLGVRVVDSEEGRIVMEVPVRDELRNPGPNGPGPVHGGVISTLVDTASAFVLQTTLDDSEDSGLTTTSLDVSYLRPATDDLRAEAEVVRAGRSMGVTDVEITSVGPDGDRKTVAVGRTNYRLFRGTDE